MTAHRLALDQLADRNLANTIGCPYCGQPAGHTCLTTDFDGSRHELVNPPAHPRRLDDARTTHAADCPACGASAGAECGVPGATPCRPHPARRRAAGAAR